MYNERDKIAKIFGSRGYDSIFFVAELAGE
jgi:hypothetical protein